MKGSPIKTRSKGFTLIEILVVIGIIAILAAVVIIALNPARQFAQARNSQRWSNVNTVLNAVGQRLADNRGNWPSTGGCAALPTTFTIVGSGSGNFDLAACVVPTYVSTMVTDPSNTDVSPEASTGYELQQGTDGRITVRAPYAELSETITVVR
jgi:type IV pilus assembly protein PilA